MDAPLLTIDGRRRDLGGFEVSRVLPYWQRRMVGPFIFFDHLGPLQLPSPVPPGADVRPHPHIGLATLTYLFAGELTHRDSTGAQQLIRPGEVNWMTAGRGITHSERFDGLRARGGGSVHGLQCWVALPGELEESAPSFVHHGVDDLPHLQEPGVSARLIAGTAYGLASPLQGASPLCFLHVELEAKSLLPLPGEPREQAVYVVSGSLEADGATHPAGRMLVFDARRAPRLRAQEACTLMLLGGEPVGTRHIWWNFVSSREERIEAAKADWAAGRFALPPHDADEFIPLPDEPRPAEPLS